MKTFLFCLKFWRLFSQGIKFQFSNSLLFLSCMCMYTHTHIHMHSRTHIHTHTQVLKTPFYCLLSGFHIFFWNIIFEIYSVLSRVMFFVIFPVALVLTLSRCGFLRTCTSWGGRVSWVSGFISFISCRIWLITYLICISLFLSLLILFLCFITGSFFEPIF